jgi:myo-inositol-1(or 4)-monophosphatase
MTSIPRISDIGEVLSKTEQIVRRAGQTAKDAFGVGGKVSAKADGTPVTDADIEVERQLVGALRAEFPDHGFVCEESGEQAAEADYQWIIDPIDGTAYFSRGVPLYSLSVALRHGEDLVLGVVFQPENGDLFSALAGQGAKRNGAAIRCSSASDLGEARICVEIPHRRLAPPLTDYALAKLPLLMQRVDRLRVIGVSALGLCYTAAAGFDAYLNLSGSSKVWDLAAGQVILREAGGTYTKRHNHVIVGGPLALHDQLVELLDV